MATKMLRIVEIHVTGRSRSDPVVPFVVRNFVKRGENFRATVARGTPVFDISGRRGPAGTSYISCERSYREPSSGFECDLLCLPVRTTLAGVRATPRRLQARDHGLDRAFPITLEPAYVRSLIQTTSTILPSPLSLACYIYWFDYPFGARAPHISQREISRATRAKQHAPEAYNFSRNDGILKRDSIDLTASENRDRVRLGNTLVT